LTGKELKNSSIFLTLIAITVGQATYNIVKKSKPFQNHFATILFVCGMVTYAAI
jgi:NAD(P)H-quinone oxidoreductase subunit 5